MIAWLGAAIGLVIGMWLGAHPDPRATVRQQWQSRLITGGIGVLAGIAFGNVITPSSMPPWHERIHVVESAGSFDQALAESEGEALVVDFFATWCGPCRGMAPNINALAAEGARIAVVDVDANPDLAQRYQVEMLPTLLVFRDGEIIHRDVGYHSTEELRSLARDQ